MRVLLVEDEPDLGAAIKRTLNQESMVWVLDGTEAWEYLENQWIILRLVTARAFRIRAMQTPTSFKQFSASLDANSQRPPGR